MSHEILEIEFLQMFIWESESAFFPLHFTFRVFYCILFLHDAHDVFISILSNDSAYTCSMRGVSTGLLL